MQLPLRKAVLFAGLALMNSPAHACRIYAPMILDDIKYADVVVVGRISNYEIVLDQKVRNDRKKRLNNSANMRPALRESSERQTGFLGDYARFELRVDEVLIGTAPQIHTVTWDNSTFSEPKTMPSGPFLIALRYPTSKLPPVRGPSATIGPSPNLGSLTILQAPCSSAFILPSENKEATTLREILKGR